MLSKCQRIWFQIHPMHRIRQQSVNLYSQCKKRAVNAQRNKTEITNTISSIENNVQYGHINTAQDRAKQRVVKNSIRVRVAGATRLKEKVIELIKDRSIAVLNMAKITIANTKK